MSSLDEGSRIFPGWEVTDAQDKAMREFCDTLSWSAPKKFCLAPLNFPACLMHWRALSAALLTMTETNYQLFLTSWPIRKDKNRPPFIEPQDQQPTLESGPELPEAFDAHFHLDRLLAGLGLPDSSSLADVERTMGSADLDYQVALIGGVAVFCDPTSFPSTEAIRQVRQAGFHVAIGIHPKHPKIWSAKWSQFEECLREDVCLGEVGIDHSVRPDLWDLQDETLERALHLLRRNQVLVLHCRGRNNDPTASEAYRRCFSIITRMVSPEQAIHLHCFTGRVSSLKEWVHTFPNAYFGFTNKAKSFNKEQREALCAVPANRLLIETDAPYFAVNSAFNGSAPHLIGYTAGTLANIRKCSAADLLRVTVRNGQDLYGGVHV